MVQISFYHTELDAQNEISPIVNTIAYTNTINPEIIWVRVEYALTNCASIVSFEIIVNALPEITTPEPLELCDNGDDGEDSNGVVQTFILGDKDAEILNGIAPTAATVSYHFTQADAESGANAIASDQPFTNTDPFVQTLWVRVEFTHNGCYSLTTLTLRVNPLPTPLTPEPVEACDADANGFTEFELGAALIAEIQNGETGVTITFHETFIDAENNTNALSDPYTNISTEAPIIIYARDTYDLTGCYRIVEVVLVVNPSPQPTQPDNYEICDDDYDGFAQFDLSSQNSIILGDIDETTVTLSYHLSQDDADTGANPIDSTVLFTNTINPQTIFIRLENNITACFNTLNFDLIVNPIPDAIDPNDLDPLEVCDNGDDNLEVAEFDLESAISEIPGMVIYFFATLAEAEAGDPTDRLLSPYSNTSNPQTIFVRIEDLNTGCFSLTTLDLRVLPIPQANYDPSPLELCDDDTDGDATNGIVQSFDVSLATTDILNGELNTSVVYYLTEIGAQDQDLADIVPIPYENLDSPFSQIVYAVVTDDLSSLSCSVIVELELIVNPLPVLDTTFVTYQFCEPDTDDSYLGDLHEMDIFLLDDSDQLNDMTFSYYTSSADAAVPINPLPSPYLLENFMRV